MTRSRDRVHVLVVRMARHRAAQSLALAMAGVALAAPVVALAAVLDTGVDAISDSVRAEFGHVHGWKLQATTSAAQVVARAPGVTAVRVESVSVATQSARAAAVGWTADNGNARLGLLVEGRRAASEGEVSISRHLAETLSVDVGSSVTIHHGSTDDAPLRIVGITDDPADRLDDRVISVSPGGVGVADTSYWIASHVSHELDLTPGLTASSVDGAIRTRLQHLPGGLSVLERIIPFAGLLSVLAALAAVMVQLPGARRDVEALETAGMASARAWRIVACWIAVLVSVGAAAGAVVSVLALTASARQVSAAVGQSWSAVSVSVPWTPAVLVVCLPMLVAIVPWHAWGHRLGRARGLGAPTWSGRRSFAIGVVLGLVGVLSTLAGVMANRGAVGLHHAELFGLAGVLGTVAGVRLMSDRWAGVGSGPATSQVVRRFTAQLTAGSLIALVVGTACAGYVAWHSHDAHALAQLDVAPQQPGSFLVFQAPSEAADKIVDRYRDLGGAKTFVYDLPDEDRASIRATSSGVVRCLGEGRVTDEVVGSCLGDHGGVMSFPALDPRAAPDEVAVDPHVLDASGDVGIIGFGPGGREVTGSRRVAATPRPGLGGNMPGLVMSPTNPLAVESGLVPSGLVQLGMLDFGRLHSDDAARMRGLVAQLAPAAQTSDTTDGSEDDESAADTLVVAVVGAAVALMIQLTAGAALVSGGARVRSALAAVGVPGRRCWAVCARVAAPSLLAIVIGTASVLLVASRVGYAVPAHVGWVWALPLAVQAVGVVVVCGLLLRAPRRP